MKFKGHVLKISGREYTLRQQLSEGGFSVIYSTSNPETVCKVQVLSNSNIEMAYMNEKNALQELKHKNIIKMISSKQQKTTQGNVGFMILENCPKGTAFNILEKEPDNVPEKTILSIMKAVAAGLSHIHSKGISHRDIKLENVLVSSQGEFKLCDFGSSSRETIKTIDKNNRPDIEDFIQKTTTPIYRSPQQLDLYSGYEIGTKVDVFALGVLGFILCFKKQPFETRLSAINQQYFLNDQHPYSKQLIDIIVDCFTIDPSQRPTAQQIHNRIDNLLKLKRIQIPLNYSRELDQTTDQLSRTNEKMLKRTSIAQTGFFDKIKRIYSQMTTQTEGWTLSFIEDNQQAPNLKFNRSIISKCWQKRYKVQKFYALLWKFADQNKSKCLVTLKLLTLLHNFLRKGPIQGLTSNQQYSPIKLCTKIYMNWKITQKPIHETDFKRNTYVMLLIRMYCLLIIAKIKLCYENSDLIEGNYSIVPYLMHQDSRTILKIPFIESMIQFLQICSQFHEALHRHSYLVDLQRTMILSVVDEEYCLISTLTFIFCTFKRAIAFSEEDLDLGKLSKKINSLENRYKQIYVKLHDLFKTTSKFASLFQHNEFQLNLKVLDYISNIQINNKKSVENFSISKYLNYRESICGLKIPLTYQQVIKNPNFLKELDSKQTKSKEYIELEEYKACKSKGKMIKKQSPNMMKMKEQSPNMGKKQQPVNSPKDNQLKNKASKTDFSSFTLSMNEKPQGINKIEVTAQNKDIFKTMQFTHQNLNQDFNTFTKKPEKDKFADFMSIVDQKFERDKMQAQKKTDPSTEIKNMKSLPNDKMKQKQNQNLNLNQASKQIYHSMKNQANTINKIELINFFDDQEPVKSPPKQVKEIEVQKPSGQQSHFLEEKKQMISRIKEINIFQETAKSESFIDLKGFIVEEVKKSAEQYFIEYSALKFQKKIGFGHSSEVFKGVWRGREVAIKKIKDDISTPSAQKQFKREIMTSVKIRHHPQLVTLIGVAQHQNFFYIINQYCNGATLFDILHQSNVPLPWKTRISMAKQIAKGMVFLHTNEPPIIHRDLKSLNVLLVNKYSDKHPDSMQIKIADFGLSRDFASTYMTGVLGTYHWMAPEIFNNEPYSLKADVYSFAIVLWEIAARKPPYLNMKNPQSLMKFVTIENGRPDLTELPNDMPKQYLNLMVQCWNTNPLKRPDFQQILEVLCRLEFF